jgi:acyl dehydratase
MQTDNLIPAGEALGAELGTRVIEYREDNAILYALAVGAQASDLELVFERDLRVLPTYALTHGLWACDALGQHGFFSSASALHGSQRFELYAPIPPRGRFELHARVAAVWDKGSAAVFDIDVECELWRATYSIFAPGCGGWGGARGPSMQRVPPGPPASRLRVGTSSEQAVLYRLTGDRHLIHVDPDAARAIGEPRPILHGLCTLGFAARELAGLLGHHPCDLTSLDVRFTAAVLPGDQLELRAWDPQPDGSIPFAVAVGQSIVLDGGQARFR